MWPSPRSIRPRMLSRVMSACLERDPPGGRSPQPGDRLDELALTVAVDARDADDLALPHLQADPVHQLDAALVDNRQIGHGQHRGARLAGLFVDLQQHIAADHQPRQLLAGRPLGGQRADHLAAAQHGDPVGDLQHLVQLMGDEDDRRAALRQRADGGEQLLSLLGGEHRRRLVEDQHLGTPVERLQDLDPLLLGHPDRLHAGVRPHLQPEALRQLGHPPVGLGVVEQRAVAGLVGKHDVLGHRHHRDQHEVLVHHADAGVDRVPGRTDPQRPPAQQDLARVGLGQPVEHVHQRALAGAVLAQQRQHLAAAHREIDIAVRDHAAVALGDAAKLEEGVGLHLARNVPPGERARPLPRPALTSPWACPTPGSRR